MGGLYAVFIAPPARHVGPRAPARESGPLRLNVRMKKLILVLGFMPALLIYVGGVLALADHVPAHWLVQLVFYIVAGTAWAFPLKPLFAWVNREPTA